MIMIMIRRIAAITFIRRCFVSSRTFRPVYARPTHEFYVLNVFHSIHSSSVNPAIRTYHATREVLFVVKLSRSPVCARVP